MYVCVCVCKHSIVKNVYFDLILNVVIYFISDLSIQSIAALQVVCI